MSSKELRPVIYVDSYVSSINQARNYARRAEQNRNNLKSELWGMVMATPKDVTRNGEDPISNLKERFEDIWEELWNAFIDDYKYSAIADDAEYSKDSLVKETWKKEEEEENEWKEYEKKRNDFFNRFNGVLNKYNFDDQAIFEKWDSGEITIDDSFTKEDRDSLVKEIRAKEIQELTDTLKKIKENG